MIQVEDLCIEQGGFRLEHISFTIEDGKYAVLMGRSGCGKTTIIEAICGLRKVTRGHVRLSDREVTSLRPAERNIGYVPQDVALFPGYKVRDQLAFSLVVRDAPEARIAERVEHMAGLLGIEHLLDRMPEGLSGGEAKRVALGRALVPQPEVLCLDEPLSNLDEDINAEMVELLGSTIRQEAVTVLHITHSRHEADRLADIRLSLVDGVMV
ncbi:MAG: ABC-type sugar transport system ATPase subunit [Kiritimatiellia bacterium]